MSPQGCSACLPARANAAWVHIRGGRARRRRSRPHPPHRSRPYRHVEGHLRLCAKAITLIILHPHIVDSDPFTAFANSQLLPSACFATIQGSVSKLQMISETPPAIAARLMSEFAQRTGLSPVAQNPRRYLWTDAFAVCNFLELCERTGDQQYRRCARELIDQVHRELGRYRSDDVRKGWISGLDDEKVATTRRWAALGLVSLLESVVPMNPSTSSGSGTETVSISIISPNGFMPFVRRPLSPATVKMSAGRVSWQKQLSGHLSAGPNPVRSLVSTGR